LIEKSDWVDQRYVKRIDLIIRYTKRLVSSRLRAAFYGGAFINC